MATGIVSVAALLQGLPLFSDTLFAVACAGWIVLAVVISLRLRRSRGGRPRLQSFAVVAATSVLAARFALAGRTNAALALWSLALLLWIALVARRPVFVEPVGGAMLAVVAVEALAVPAALVARTRSGDLVLFALAAWAFGLALYPIVTARVLLAVRRRPRFTPDLWVVMGALAIATLAGTELLIATRADRRLPWLTGFLNGADVATLAAASLLIVPLAVVDARARDARRYAAARWSFVFPLGMYATAAWTLGHVQPSELLAWTARAFLALALAAWALTTLGLARRGLSTLRRP